MKVLRLKLFQETACYKKPYAMKVSETYPLPPFSTVIGMIHYVMGATTPIQMKISVQGDYDSLFTDYQKHYFIKKQDTAEFPLVLEGLREDLNSVELKDMTSMPIYRHLLYRVNLLIHVLAEDSVLEEMYQSFGANQKVLSLGRAEDLLRIDCCEIVELVSSEEEVDLLYNAYIPQRFIDENTSNYIPYRLNSMYEIINHTRKWEKILVGFMNKGVTFDGEEIDLLIDVIDDKEYPVFFYG